MAESARCAAEVEMERRKEMSDLELTIEALKRCVSPENFNRALAEIRDTAVQYAASPISLDLASMAQDLLTKLGVPSHLKGYRYLVTGLQMMVEDPTVADAVTKRLYPEIAAVHGTTASRVERGVRHAIETIWDNGDLEDLEEYFGRSVSYYKGRPTNSAFMVRSADLLRREFTERKERAVWPS